LAILKDKAKSVLAKRTNRLTWYSEVHLNGGYSIEFDATTQQLCVEYSFCCFGAKTNLQLTTPEMEFMILNLSTMPISF
jgi:hypothetical protein